jgi:cystathionine gamma-synthase
MSTARSLQTIAAANGIGADTNFGAVTPPLYLTTTFTFAGYEQARAFDYTRAGNPSRALLADTIAQLEGGAGAVVTASGMAAVDLLLGTLGSGDLIVAPHDCYGGTYRLFAARAAKRQFNVVFVDQSDEAALAAALQRQPALVLIETPSNPLMRVVDVRSVSGRAKSAGAKVAVDNTFLSPALQRPLTLGADYVIHSTTKYLNGHSDVVGGAVVAADPDDVSQLDEWSNITGVTGAPFDAFLTLRGLRTLFPRIAQQQRTAGTIAAFLDQHPRVAATYYPGLTSHPGHEIAKVQQTGFGAMLSFELAGGTEEVRRFVEAVEGFTLAESLGGVESLIAHPTTMTHASMGAEARRAAGISDTLLRLSVGLEAVEDLIAGLERGFDALT